MPLVPVILFAGLRCRFRFLVRFGSGCGRRMRFYVRWLRSRP